MGVGKSCLLHQFTEKKCKCSHDSTPSHLPAARLSVYTVARFNRSASDHFRFLCTPTEVGHIEVECELGSETLLLCVSQLQPPIYHSALFLFSATINKPDAVFPIHSSRITSCKHTHMGLDLEKVFCVCLRDICRVFCADTSN